MQEGVKSEDDFEKENCWNLADFCLVCGIKLRCHETTTLHHPVCAASQKYFWRFCSCWARVLLWGSWDTGPRGITPVPLLGAQLSLCQHTHLWNCALILCLRGQTGGCALAWIIWADWFRQWLLEQVGWQIRGAVTSDGEEGGRELLGVGWERNLLPRVCYSYSCLFLLC